MSRNGIQIGNHSADNYGSPFVASLTPDQALGAIDRIEASMRSNDRLCDERDLHPCVIDSCQENVVGLDIKEDDPQFWPTVLEQVIAELDSFGVRVHADYSISFG